MDYFVHLLKMRDFGPRIRKIRLSKDYSQDYVSSKLGITLSAYSKIERGKTDPSLSRMMQISEVLEFNLGDFFPVDVVKIDSFKVFEDPNHHLYGFVTRREFEECLHMIADIRGKISEIFDKISH